MSLVKKLALTGVTLTLISFVVVMGLLISGAELETLRLAALLTMLPPAILAILVIGLGHSETRFAESDMVQITSDDLNLYELDEALHYLEIMPNLGDDMRLQMKKDLIKNFQQKFEINESELKQIKKSHNVS